MSKFGLPYMGSKDKIAESLSMIFPKADHFYDLFGGGFSISHCMLLNKRHKFKYFHYNEIKSDIVGLVRKAIAGDFNYDKFKPAWVSREDFFANLNDCYIRVCWSFGSDQKSYLFGKEIEAYKKSMHMAVIFGEFDDTAFKVLGFREWPAIAKTIKQRRLYFRQKVAFNNKGMSIGVLQRLKQLQQLENLEHLQQLEQLERLQQLSFSSLSYDEVEILPNSVVYCDPPYAGTADYGNNFDTKKFLDWAATREFPVYISEYNISDDRFKLVYSVDKRAKFSSTKTVTKIKQENVYWNGVKNA